MEFPAVLAAISHWLNRTFRAKGKKVSNTVEGNVIRTGMFSFSKVYAPVTVINYGDVLAQSSDPHTKVSVKDTLAPETAVAFHRIIKQELVVGTKAGPMTIGLAGNIVDQERTIDHVLAAIQQNNVLAHLSDEDMVESDQDERESLEASTVADRIREFLKEVQSSRRD